MKNLFRLSLVSAACLPLLACNDNNNNEQQAVTQAPPTSMAVTALSGPEPIYTGRLIVKYKESKGASQQNGLMSAASATAGNSLAVMESRVMTNAAQSGVQLTLERSLGNRTQLYRLDDNANLRAAIKALSKEPDLEYVEADRLMQPLFTPNDPQYSQQWHYFGATGMNADEAWDSADGTGTVVSVIDTGIRPNHPDLQNQLLPGYDFISNSWMANDGNGRDADPTDPGDYLRKGECTTQFGYRDAQGRVVPYNDTPASFHGSHVAGTIAAETNNGIGVAGVAYGARVYSARALGRCGGSTADIIDAIRWSAGLSVSGVPANPNPADVINMSLGGGGACGQAYQDAINQAVAQGTVVVVAAGNDNINVSNASPANCNNVISVAASGRDGNRSWFSNYGNLIDITAPGGSANGVAADDILSTLNLGSYSVGSEGYGTMAGTSMASPHVAGVAALIKSVDASLTPAQVEQIIKDSARPFQNTDCTTANCGEGFLDAGAAVALAAGNGGNSGGNGGSDVLTDGAAVTNIGLAQGQGRTFTIEVPANASSLGLSLTGSNGDADLWVRKDSAATSSAGATWKSETGSSNESVTIASPAAGTYYVTVYGYAAFSGATLSADLAVTGGSSGSASSFENGNNVQILDNQVVQSLINVSRSGDSGTVTVSVDIKHSYRGDLRIKVIAPNGATATLQEPSNDSADNIQKSWSLNASGVESQGNWTLSVEDVYSGDSGYIDSWSLDFGN